MENITAQPEAVEVLAQPEAKAPEQEASQPIAEGSVEKVTTEASQPKFVAKYNKEEREFGSWDEARPFVEKGMNYDKLKERLGTTESELESLKKPLSAIAQKLGKDPKEVSEIFAKQWQAAEDAKLAKAQGKPVQDVTAMREAQEAKEAAEAKARELETAEQTRQRQIQETVDFNKTYPGIDIQKLPDEVIREWIDNGKPLVDVYRVHSYGEKEAEIQALKERIATMEQKEAAAKINAENADTAPGKLGSGEPADKPLTLADLDNLTPDEKKRRHPEIWALLTGRKT